MSALGPIGALAICDVQTVRVFSFDATGGVSFVGAPPSTIRVSTAVVDGVVSFVGTARENTVFVVRNTVGILVIGGRLVRDLIRRPLRFAKRKGIITRGIDR